MMRDISILTRLQYKIRSIKGTFRIAFLKMGGMVIGVNTIIGKIDVESPGGVEIGDNCEVRNYTAFWIQNPFKNENKISIGNNVFIGRNVEFNCCDFIVIKDNCLIASSTVFVDSSHSFLKGELINQQPVKLKGIVIEEDVWIGTGCKILYGVNIGRGSIIGAGSVVNKSTLPNEIWAGIPARKIGERRLPTMG